jgi:hypothetical protein
MKTRFGGFRRWSVGLALVTITVTALAVGLGIVGLGDDGGRHAQAAPGDLVADVIIGEGEDGGSGGPNDGVGVAFDGRYLYYSAGFYDPILHRVDTSGGSHFDVTVTDSVSGAQVDVQAMSYDADRGRIWAANGSAIYLVHPTTGVAQFQFSTGVGCGLDDGLAYDATDDSMWWSCDGSVVVYHYDVDGTPLGSFRVDSGPGDMRPECNPYSSGIAVGGDILYLGADGCDYYFTYDKSGNKLAAYPYPALRSEDLECDPVTFAPTEVMWIRDAYDGHIRAFEVPPGTCGPGGGEPRPRQAIIFVQGIVSESTCSDDVDPPGKDGFEDRVAWMKDSLLRDTSIKAHVTVSESDIVYLSYSDGVDADGGGPDTTRKYCDGGTGENGAIPEYVAADTCNRGIEESYYGELKGLIERVVDTRPAGTKVSIVGHSQGGFIASYVVGRLKRERPDFVKDHISSVITFDSFPEGFGALIPHDFELLWALDCGLNPPSVADWFDYPLFHDPADDAQEAARPFPDDNYQVAFYTLDAGGPGPLDHQTNIRGQRLHEQFGGDNHSTIWNREDQRKEDLLACNIISNILRPFGPVTDTCVIRGIDPIFPGDTALASAEVPSGSRSAVFTAGWTGSTVILTPITPSGVRIDPHNLPPGASHSVGLNFDSYEFLDPEPGTWTLELFGANVPPQGEQVAILVDVAQPDSDADGVPDVEDACPDNPEDVDSFQDDDGCPDPDNDGDGVLDDDDNCPLDANGNQADLDTDGLGDACDPDDDGDGVDDATDNCPRAANTDQADGDGDSVGNVCDNCPAVSNPSQADSDSDGVGNACEATPTATPTPSPTPTRTPTPTPTPWPVATPLPTLSMPMVEGWNSECYVGPADGIEDALGGIVSKVLGVYRLDATSQEFERWFPGRADISNIGTVNPYDQLFVLMSAAATWEQEQSTAGQTNVSLIQGWNSVCYTGQQKAVSEATSGIAGMFGILYMFADDQAWARYVPGRSDLSDMTELEPYYPVLMLVTQAGGAQWIFNP